MKYLVTGASGFIGRAFSAHAATLPGVAVVACSRQYHGSAPPGVRIVEVQRYDDEPAMAAVLKGVDCVVHAAGRAHVMAEDAADPLAAFRRANVAMTARLARQAAANGVRRLVFLSSVGVNGESTTRPFTELDLPAPASAYAVAKHEAEQALTKIVSETNLEVVIVRPPLVTGPNAPGNFGRLVRLARSGIPLPFGGIKNRRSVVGITNLCEFLTVVSQHPAASNETFLVADPQDISTSALIAALRSSMQMPPRLVPVPAGTIKGCLRLLGWGGVAQQLYGDLQISAAKAWMKLGWMPQYETLASIAAITRNGNHV